MKKWKAILKDNSTVEENQADWQTIKDQVVYLYLDNNGQNIYLPKNADQYEQTKTASADILSGAVQIETRNISAKIGNNIVRIRVNEKTGNINIETKTL